MEPISLLLIFLSYFLLLMIISWLVGRKSGNSSFYNGDRKSPWLVVAFGMVGATLSGVTFISVPGEVGNSSFHYLQFVMGNVVGYVLIAFFLLPYYYRKNIISIYSVLEEKLGKSGYLTTSGFFILSKVMGAAFRLYLAALVIHMAISEPLSIPFGATVAFCLLLIWLYTVKSGIKTVVWSDTIQTAILLSAVVITIVVLFKQINAPVNNVIDEIFQSGIAKIWEFEWRSPNNFFKQFVAGVFVTIALNGFDQDIVQKNLTCKNSRKARSNMLVFSVMFAVAVFVFLALGALLYYYANTNGIEKPLQTDKLYPLIALNHLGVFVQVFFVLGISAAAFSSADSATTALTTAFSIDFLKIDRLQIKKQKRIRSFVHFLFSVLIFGVIILFYKLNNESVVVAIFKAAGYTYGPIFGVFLFVFFSKRIVRRRFVLPICLISPLITWATTLLSERFFNGYKFGFELIVVNTAITYVLLALVSKRH
ncbi:MAG TPA: sodium:solute symporter [Prolixibacteraceae bacterium]|nr:sodium:solute symporter [Prolixibacteraceae bacterium]HPR60364.1 sodium:solute symporter [Prolixibacteraceae bacterium]